MHPVDALFQVFLESSIRCCASMDSFDIVPETLYATRFGESEDVFALDADDTLYSGPGVASNVSADVMFAPPSGPGRASAARAVGGGVARRRPTVSVYNSYLL